jgi:hypothetical protein
MEVAVFTKYNRNRRVYLKPRDSEDSTRGSKDTAQKKVNEIDRAYYHFSLDSSTTIIVFTDVF